MGQRGPIKPKRPRTTTPVTPYDPVRIRCHFCESKWFGRTGDYAQHMRALHPELTVLIVCEAKYLLCASPDDSRDHPLTYMPKATWYIMAAAKACIKLLRTIGLEVTAWTAMAEIKGRDPIVVTDKGAVRKLPVYLNLIPSVRVRHQLARDLSVHPADDGSPMSGGNDPAMSERGMSGGDI